MTYEVDITATPQFLDVDLSVLRHAVVQALHIESVAGAVLSFSLVDNKTIHAVNHAYLQHDFPTDVISFQLDWRHPTRNSPKSDAERRAAGAHIEGEIMVSVEYAESEAARLGWELQSELTLYSVHGMLHVCGYDDQEIVQQQIMRARETFILEQLGIPKIPRDPDTAIQSTELTQDILE
ncbi:MAG: rRNA maturation RNase YbeY [Fuerstiella sp.]|nr:rRNA maturation RNase YbeY [Fuerstiella sp.]